MMSEVGRIRGQQYGVVGTTTSHLRLTRPKTLYTRIRIVAFLVDFIRPISSLFLASSYYMIDDGKTHLYNFYFLLDALSLFLIFLLHYVILLIRFFFVSKWARYKILITRVVLLINKFIESIVESLFLLERVRANNIEINIYPKNFFFSLSSVSFYYFSELFSYF